MVDVEVADQVEDLVAAMVVVVVAAVVDVALLHGALSTVS